MSQDIIGRLKDGNEIVFSNVVKDWQDMVFNTAINIVQNEADAEDIVQDVFVQLHQSLESFRGDASLSTWLYRVTINKSLDHEKRKRRLKRGGGLQSFFNINEGEEPSHFIHPGVLTENKEKAAILYNALKQIPESQRIAFILHKMEGRSYQEISSITGNTLMSVESLLGRARNNLKKILKTYYELNLK